MDRKDLERMVLNTPSKRKRKGDVVQRDRDVSRNSKEDSIIDAIDMKKTIVEHADWIGKLRKGQIDVGQFLSSVSPDAVVELFHIAMSGESEKTRLAALQDILDRAGHGKVQKHAIANVDPNQPKEQIISLIMGLNKKSGVIEIEEDGQDQDQEK